MTGLAYTVQPDFVVFDSVTLTSDMADNRSVVMDVKGMSKISLDIDYNANNAANFLEFQIEHSTDGTNWYSLVIDDTSTVSAITPRVWNVTNTNNVNVLVDIAYHKLRVSVSEDVTSGGAGTVSMTAVLSGE